MGRDTTGLRSFNDSTGSAAGDGIILRLREFIVKRITVIKFEMNNIEVAMVQAVDESLVSSLANVIVAGFGERRNLIREGKMFVKDETNISSKVGGVR